VLATVSASASDATDSEALRLAPRPLARVPMTTSSNATGLAGSGPSAVKGASLGMAAATSSLDTDRDGVDDRWVRLGDSEESPSLGRHCQWPVRLMPVPSEQPSLPPKTAAMAML
jgi:hypothetical protein